jgi:hypothetical protein
VGPSASVTSCASSRRGRAYSCGDLKPKYSQPQITNMSGPRHPVVGAEVVVQHGAVRHRQKPLQLHAGNPTALQPRRRFGVGAAGGIAHVGQRARYGDPHPETGLCALGSGWPAGRPNRGVLGEGSSAYRGGRRPQGPRHDGRPAGAIRMPSGSSPSWPRLAPRSASTAPLS